MQRRIAVGLCTNGSSLTWRYTAHDGTLAMAEMEGALMTRCFVRGAGIAEGTGDVIGEIIGTEESNAHPLFYFVNHRGDTMAAYVQHDTTKTLAAEYRYDAFGNLISSTTNEPAFLPRFTFSTKEYLAEAQLYLYAYRVYDPVAGRWTQRDPIDYQDSANLYQFCGNNPVKGIDALGDTVYGYDFIGPLQEGDYRDPTYSQAELHKISTPSKDETKGTQQQEQTTENNKEDKSNQVAPTVMAANIYVTPLLSGYKSHNCSCLHGCTG